MSNNYYTADTHFNHRNIIKYCNRPFKDLHEMNETIIENINSVVKKYDNIYFIGDFGFGDCSEFFNRLNGKKILIIGSHDKDNLRLKWDFVKPCMMTNRNIWLSHYAHRVWPRSHYGTWHLFGHSHGKMEPWGKSFDAGVDCHNFFPWSDDEIKEVMNKLVIKAHREIREK